MNLRWASRPVVIWAVLCALTLLSVAQVEQGWWRSAAPLLVVMIAALKAQLVIRHYMEAWRARPLWRLLYATWIFAVAATLVIGYLLSAH